MKLKKIIKFLIAACLAIHIAIITAFAIPQSTTSVASGEIPYESYTYWQNYGSSAKTAVYCKPMYEVKASITAKSIGVASIEEISDICSDSAGNIYILDNKKSSVYVTDKNYKLIHNIGNIVYNGEKQNIEGAKGIFVKDRNIYIADTEHTRILVIDTDGTVKNIIDKPDSQLIPDDFKYRPIKIAVDSKDYIYIACDGSYYGALVYSPKMEFLGFYGANTVKASVLDVIQNIVDKLFSNDTKKSSSVLALPYQFTDMVVGPGDFIYTATGRSGGDKSQTGQISMMNPGGRNILKSSEINYLDGSVGSYQTKIMTQDVAGIDVDKDGFFYIVDSTYGRVFWYDSENNLICVFGGSMAADKQKGTFNFPGAIAVNGTDIAVSDSMKDCVTVFGLTEYGSRVRNAQLKTLKDDFENTVDEWQAVINEDKNNQLAYRGIAKAYYTLGENEKALEYAKSGMDRDTYSSAFKKVRQQFLEKWFTLIFVGLIIVIALLIWLLRLKKKKNIKLINNDKIKVMSNSILHPFNSFRLVKEKGQGSVLIAAVILLIYYILSAISDTAGGFAFNYFDASSYNSFYILLSTVGFVGLWTVSNWLVCVLLGGIGRIKEIFIVTCYSLLPAIFGSGISLILSHILVPDEFVFVSMLQSVCLIYSLFMIMVGIMKVHDFEFGKFLWTTILTFIAMLVVIFLIFLMFLLTQQLICWIQTLIIEIKYR